MTRITTIANQKGGIGKTTTAHALCTGLTNKGYSVLAIDADAQCNLSYGMGANIDGKGFFDVLNNEPIKNLIQKTKQGDILSGSKNLTGADKKFMDYGSEYLLKKTLKSLKNKYKYIIIDTPPQLGILTINCLIASTDVVIPITADIYAVMGLSQLIETVGKIKEHGNRSLVIAGLLLTRYNNRTVLNRKLRGSLKGSAALMGTKLYETIIRENISIREAQLVGDSIFNHAARSNGAKDYKSFIDEYLKDEESISNE